MQEYRMGFQRSVPAGKPLRLRKHIRLHRPLHQRTAKIRRKQSRIQRLNSKPLRSPRISLQASSPPILPRPAPPCQSCRCPHANCKINFTSRPRGNPTATGNVGLLGAGNWGDLGWNFCGTGGGTWLAEFSHQAPDTFPFAPLPTEPACHPAIGNPESQPILGNKLRPMSRIVQLSAIHS